MKTPEAEGQESLFDIEPLETPESLAGKSAKNIFDEWYPKWYEGRYTQTPGHIMKILKEAILDKIDPYDLAWAMNLLGEKQQTVSKASLQFALAQIFQYKKLNGIDSSVPQSERKYVESL